VRSSLSFTDDYLILSNESQFLSFTEEDEILFRLTVGSLLIFSSCNVSTSALLLFYVNFIRAVSMLIWSIDVLDLFLIFVRPIRLDSESISFLKSNIFPSFYCITRSCPVIELIKFSSYFSFMR